VSSRGATLRLVYCGTEDLIPIEHDASPTERFLTEFGHAERGSASPVIE